MPPHYDDNGSSFQLEEERDPALGLAILFVGTVLFWGGVAWVVFA